MIMKQLIFMALLSIYNISTAQVQENFDDGNFNSNPSWSGDKTDWQLTDGLLQLNASSAGKSYLSTPSKTIENASWEFWLQLDFNPSGSNYVKIYLVSDQPDLSQPLNGYYVKVGDTEDEISLYWQAGNQSTKIIDGVDDRVNLDEVTANIKITRDELGNWELMSDIGATGNFISEGTAFDNRVKKSNYFGLSAHYTSTRSDKIFFDDILVTGQPQQDDSPPQLKSIDFVSRNQLTLFFSEPLSPATAEDVLNYSIEELESPKLAQLDANNPTKVALQFSTSFNDASFYTLTVQNLSDTEDNRIEPIRRQFFYFEEKEAKPLQLVINELLPDPTPAIGLPGHEFIEIYNNSELTFNLKDWSISDNSNEGKLDSIIIFPNEYLLLVPSGSKMNFDGYGVVQEVTDWPSLNNGGDLIYIKDYQDRIIDSVAYDRETYQDEEKSSGGWSLERIFPSLSCPSVNNWRASASNEGGTPGYINSVYSDTPDTEPPVILSSQLLSDSELKITFDEIMDENSLLNADYQLQPYILMESISIIEDLQAIILSFQQPLQAGKDYQLTIENATDCIGNQLQENTIQVIYDITPPKLSEIVFTSSTEMSLLFSEGLLPDSALNLNNYMLNNWQIPKEVHQPLPNEVVLTFNSEYNIPSSQLLSIKNLSDWQGNIILKTDTTFSYRNELDTLLVKGENHLLVILSHQPDPSSLEDMENFLLNKVIAPALAFADDDNPKAIHLIFEVNLEHNSWYKLYLKNIFDISGTRISTPAAEFYYDNEAPEIETLLPIDENRLKIKFNEPIDSVSAAVLVNYEVNKSIGYPQSMTQEDDSTIVLNFKLAFKLNERYQLEINHLKDIYGNSTSRERDYFVYDSQAPVLVDWQLVFPDSLILTFSEDLKPSSIDKLNFKLNETKLTEATVKLLPFNQNKISIVFQSLQNDTEYQLEITNLTDINGNKIEAVKLKFSTVFPLLGKVEPLADTILQLSFSEIVNQSDALQANNYLLNNQHLPISIKYQEHRVQLVFDQHFTKLDTHSILIKNIRDLKGNIISDINQEFIFDDYVDEIRIENENTIIITFGLPVDASSISENKFSLSSLGSPFLLLPDNDDKKTIKLIFNKKLKEGENYFLNIQNILSPTGEIIPASLQSIIYDNTPPEIINLLLETPGQLKVVFSEILSKNSEKEEFFLVTGIGHPKEVALTDSIMLLSYDFDFVNQQNYTLHIDGILDLYANQLINYSYAFTYEAPREARFNEIIITEIMAHPSYVGNLPEVEYVEVFNRSNYNLPVQGIILSDGNSEGRLENAILAAGEYAILCANGAKEKMKKFGQVIGVTNMPGLNNSGEMLTLSKSNEQLIFSVTYDESWYKDFTKSQGGWSFEMIDPNNPCAGSHNWSASEAPAGGTPGGENSIIEPNPDNLGPQLSQATAIDENTIVLFFNEKLDFDRVQQITFDLEPALAVNSIKIEDDLTQVILETEQPLISGQTYQMKVTTAWDCRGNPINQEQNSAIILLPEKALPGDLVINEILFNPRQGGVEFVEIYNTSEKNILLENVSFATNTSYEILDLKYSSISPFEYQVFTKDANLLKADYPDAPLQNLMTINNLPTLNNEESSLTIFLNNQMIDSVYYHKNFHFPLIKDEKGVSLERIYSNQPAWNENNWQSAVAQVGFATPGKINSQSRTGVAHKGSLTAEPPTFAPGDPGGRSFTSINYQLDEPGKLATITIHDLNGRIIRTLVQNETLADSGSFIWNGISDQGQQVRLGAYLIVMEVYSMEGDLEIFKERVAVGRNF